MVKHDTSRSRPKKEAKKAPKKAPKKKAPKKKTPKKKTPKKTTAKKSITRQGTSAKQRRKQSKASRANFDATPSMLGYLYQCRLALSRALTRARVDLDTQISIEKFDDVAFLQDGKPRDLLQAKHHLGKSGSLSDGSEDLWKTLRVWCVAIREGTVDIKRCRFYLITTALAPKGSIASLLRPGSDSDPDEVDRKLVHVAKTHKSKSNKDAFEEYLSLARKKRIQLLRQTTLFDTHPNIRDITHSIKEQELMRVVPQAHLDAFVERLEGWWFRRIIEHLSGTNSVPLELSELEAQIDELRDQFRRTNLPIDFREMSLPDVEDSDRPFVEQLKMIRVSDRRRVFARLDYYKASAQRSRWIREGLLAAGELSRYEDQLEEEWSRVFESKTEELVNRSENTLVRAGRQIYNWAEQDAYIPIRRDCTERYVMRGSYHILADQIRVGWHPDFHERLAARGKSPPPRRKWGHLRASESTQIAA